VRERKKEKVMARKEVKLREKKEKARERIEE